MSACYAGKERKTYGYHLLDSRVYWLIAVVFQP